MQIAKRAKDIPKQQTQIYQLPIDHGSEATARIWGCLDQSAIRKVIFYVTKPKSRFIRN